MLSAAAGLSVAGAVAAGGALVYGVAWPRTRMFGPAIARGRAGCGSKVALTFDDGPHPTATMAIADALKAEGVRGTFFVIGQFVEQRPDIVRELDRRGHLIANHSFDHHHFGAFRGSRYWEDQIERAGASIEQITGKRPTYFRPPMGLKQPRLFRAARKQRCDVVTWQHSARDGIRTTTERIIRRTADRAAGGDVLALHDGVGPPGRRSPAPTVAAIRPIVQRLRQRGLQPVRLDTLLAATHEPAAPSTDMRSA